MMCPRHGSVIGSRCGVCSAARGVRVGTVQVSPLQGPHETEWERTPTGAIRRRHVEPDIEAFAADDDAVTTLLDAVWEGVS